MEIANLFFAGLFGLVGAIIGILGTRLALAQHRLQAALFVADWFRDLRSWATLCIEVLSAAIYTCRSSSMDLQETMQTLEFRHRLSALIDSGRFLLPNTHYEEIGISKPAAYRGDRHPALNYLIAAEHLLSGDFTPEELGIESRKAALIDLKREFVSSIQELLNPREHNLEVARLLGLARHQSIDPNSLLARLLGK